MTRGWSVGSNRWIMCGWDTCDWLLCEVRGVRRVLCRWRCVYMWTTIVCDVLCLGVHGYGYILRWRVVTWMVWHLVHELMLWDSRDTEGGNVLWGWLWIGVSVSNVIRGVVMWARISIRDRDRIRITVRCLGHVRGRVQVWVHNRDGISAYQRSNFYQWFE